MSLRMPGDKITDEQLLAEIDDLLRAAPVGQPVRNIEWVGRAAAALSRWDVAKTPFINGAVDDMSAVANLVTNIKGFQKILALLHQARADLRLSVGPLNIVVQKGQVFDYFDEIRKIIEAAGSEVYFVDPYLDAEFVSRYLPHVPAGVGIRLLGGMKRMTTLLPAVDVFAQQSGRSIPVRSAPDIHDRYLFIDRGACYVSGASFKDGAKNAPAILTQITDPFKAVWGTFESIWNSAKVER